MTPAERVELADFMIARWQAFRDRADPTKPPRTRVVDGLVWALARRDMRDVTMLFDTDQQASAFVNSISADPVRSA
jgi:hypothetical protein